jgi:hypothetical protein
MLSASREAARTDVVHSGIFIYLPEG